MDEKYTLFTRIGHQYISNPDVTPADRIIAAAVDMEKLLKGNLP